jgi:tRNA-specific 2-thiouridylase
MAKVAVLLSGGTDSAFAALRLTAEGHEVEGFTAVFYDANGSSLLEDAAAARQTCDTLGIAHALVDLREEFKTCVVDPFISAYAQGTTPNPCAWCNREVKLGRLVDLVRGRGFEFVATGHYARLGTIEGRTTLCEPLDRRRSQVYFLSLIDPRVLGFLMLPVGGFRKEHVRRLVKEAGLPLRARDSQDLCFVGKGGYKDFLRLGGRHPEEGTVLDTHGRRVGAHRGHTAYTVGQRFGLKGRRYYVLEKQPQTNRLVIGERAEALKTRIVADLVSLFVSPADIGSGLLAVRYRYNTPPVAARISQIEPGRITVVTEKPCFAPAPGQVLAGYGERGCLLFGGIIRQAG